MAFKKESHKTERLIFLRDRICVYFLSFVNIFSWLWIVVKAEGSGITPVGFLLWFCHLML